MICYLTRTGRSTTTLGKNTTESIQHLFAGTMEALVGGPKELEDFVIAWLSPPLQTFVECIRFTWRKTQELTSPLI